MGIMVWNLNREGKKVEKNGRKQNKKKKRDSSESQATHPSRLGLDPGRVAGRVRLFTPLLWEMKTTNQGCWDTPDCFLAELDLFNGLLDPVGPSMKTVRCGVCLLSLVRPSLWQSLSSWAWWALLEFVWARQLGYNPFDHMELKLVLLALIWPQSIGEDASNLSVLEKTQLWVYQFQTLLDQTPIWQFLNQSFNSLWLLHIVCSIQEHHSSISQIRQAWLDL